MENCRTFQIRFDKLSDGNVVTDILASNVRYERPIVSNRNVATTTEPLTADISDDGGSSVEEEQDNIREIDFAATVNWQEQAVTIDQRAIHMAYNQQCKVNVTSMGLISSSMIFNRYVPLNYIIHSINICRREKPN